MLSNTSLPLGKFPSRNAKIGAGGFTCDIEIDADGRVRVKTDTNNCHDLDRTKKEFISQIRPDNTAANMVGPGAFNPGGGGGQGVYWYGRSASSPGTCYAAFGRRVIKRTSDGGQWAYTAVPDQGANMASNDITGNRIRGPLGAIDSQNADHVVISRNTTGLRPLRSTDGFVTAGAEPTGLPTDGVFYYIVEDKTSAVVSTIRQRWYTWVQQGAGIGLYRSTNGGAAYTKVTGTPITAAHRVFCINGIVYITHTTGTVDVYNGTAWSTIAVPTIGDVRVVLKDPLVANRWIFVGRAGAYVVMTSTDGLTFTSPVVISPMQRIPGDVGWLSFTNVGTSLEVANAVIDNQVADRLILVGGLGCFETTIVTSAQAAKWKPMSAGIEQMVMRKIILPPYAKVAGKRRLLHGTSLDRCVMTIDADRAGDEYPWTHSPNNLSPATLCEGDGIDYAKSNPDFIVMFMEKVQSGASLYGYWKSFERGEPGTWMQCTGAPTQTTAATVNGGAMACQSETNFVRFPGSNQNAEYTNDGGASFNECLFNTVVPKRRGSYAAGTTYQEGDFVKWTVAAGGDDLDYRRRAGTGPTTGVLPSDASKWVQNGENGWGYTYTFNRHIACCDSAGTYWAYNTGSSGGGSDSVGLYKSYNGRDWTRVDATNIPWAGGSVKLKTVGAVEAGGALYLIHGAEGGTVSATPSTISPLRKWTPSGGWSEINNAVIREPYGLAFGKPMLPGGPETICYWGGGTGGLFSTWLSIDGGATLIKGDDYPGANICEINDVEGDPEIFGRFYFAHAGGGMSVQDYGAALAVAT